MYKYLKKFNSVYTHAIFLKIIKPYIKKHKIKNLYDLFFEETMTYDIEKKMIFDYVKNMRQNIEPLIFKEWLKINNINNKYKFIYMMVDVNNNDIYPYEDVRFSTVLIYNTLFELKNNYYTEKILTDLFVNMFYKYDSSLSTKILLICANEKNNVDVICNNELILNDISKKISVNNINEFMVEMDYYKIPLYSFLKIKDNKMETYFKGER